MFEAGAGWSDSRIIRLGHQRFPWFTGCERKNWRRKARCCVEPQAAGRNRGLLGFFEGEMEGSQTDCLACSSRQGRARWTLRLLEKKVVAMKICRIVPRPSTDRRTLKTHSQAPPRPCWSFRRGQYRVRSRHGGSAGRYMRPRDPDRPAGVPGRGLKSTARRTRRDPMKQKTVGPRSITSTSAMAPPCSFMMYCACAKAGPT